MTRVIEAIEAIKKGEGHERELSDGEIESLARGCGVLKPEVRDATCWEVYLAQKVERLTTELREAREKNERKDLVISNLDFETVPALLDRAEKADDNWKRLPEFTGVEAEMADVIIRIMDFGLARGHRIAEALEAKIEYNKTRAHKHGGKAF